MFEAFGEAVNTFMGKYYTAEDVNTDTKDAEYMLRTTQYVVGREDVSGDPSPFTAIGVFDGIRAVAQFMNGSDSLDGMTMLQRSSTQPAQSSSSATTPTVKL